MTIDIKPCPFCDGKAIIVIKTYAMPYETYSVECKQCGAQSQGYGSEADAAEAWNRRSNKEVKDVRLPTWNEVYNDRARLWGRLNDD